MRPCSCPGNSTLFGNSTRERRKGWGPTTSVPAQTGSSFKFGAKENKFKVILEISIPPVSRDLSIPLDKALLVT